MDDLAGGDVGFDRIEKANELLMAMALHAAADDLAFQDVERGKQGRGAMCAATQAPRDPGAIIENKRLGAALAFIREERLRREPGKSRVRESRTPGSG
jgi:hypothetical protein